MVTSTHVHAFFARGLTAKEIAVKTRVSEAKILAWLADPPPSVPVGLQMQTQETEAHAEFERRAIEIKAAHEAEEREYQRQSQISKALLLGWPLFKIAGKVYCARYFDILPTLTTEKYEALKASILSSGQVEQDILIDDQPLPFIIDGYHRAKIVSEAPSPVPLVSFKVRSDLNEDQKLTLAYRLNTERRQLRDEDTRAAALNLRLKHSWSNPRIAEVADTALPKRLSISTKAESSTSVLSTFDQGEERAKKKAESVKVEAGLVALRECSGCEVSYPLDELTWLSDEEELCAGCFAQNEELKEKELAEKEEPAPKKKPVNQQPTHTSKRQDHNTPPCVLDRTRLVNFIALDPCGNPSSLVKAALSYDEASNGLSVNWKDELRARGLDNGLVFVNPPFSDDKEWAEKCIRQAQQGLEIIFLSKPKTGNSWFSGLALTCQQIAFWQGRITYYNPDTGKPSDPAPFDTCLTYWGPNRAAFEKAFSDVCWFRYAVEVQP